MRVEPKPAPSFAVTLLYPVAAIALTFAITALLVLPPVYSPKVRLANDATEAKIAQLEEELARLKGEEGPEKKDVAASTAATPEKKDAPPSNSAAVKPGI